MSYTKNIKDIVYALLQEPTLDKFREFLHSQTGEHNSIDFKKEWIENADLAKMMLAMANTQGGIIVFGVSENEDKSPNIEGLSSIKDHAVISNEIKNLISSNLRYEIYDFSYSASEYEALQGKNFQMLVVEDSPEFIPFFAKRESGTLKQNMIYVRRGTSCEIANEEEFQNIINRRINYIHPLNGEPLQLPEHLRQLKILYEHIEKHHVYYDNSIFSGLSALISSVATTIGKGEKRVEPNPRYPDESYDEFVSRMITEKKKKIERVLDLY